jgi:predicted DsbA family dithiol-disulfide isomerase
MSEAKIRITEFSDPYCPWAFSSEPHRLRLRWTYGDQIEWRLHMVVLSDSPQDYLDKGFTPEKLAPSMRQIAEDHGMPIDPSMRERMCATEPACRAVVAAELFAPEIGRALMRALQHRNFGGELIDEPEVIAAAARDAGLDPDELVEWMERPETRERLASDRAIARDPAPAAVALHHKLAPHGDGYRYTCPSYRVTRLSDGMTLDSPGFQPPETYDVNIANLEPGLERRPPAETVEEALRWAGEPLATQEVAFICGLRREQARERLSEAEGVVEHPVGTDSYWSLA